VTFVDISAQDFTQLLNSKIHTLSPSFISENDTTD